MAAVGTAGAAAIEVAAAKPPPTHDPASTPAAASTPMLREWSYRPPAEDALPPQPQGTARSSSLPARPSPVGRSRTPVAFAVKQEEAEPSAAAAAAMGGSRHPWLNAAAASAAAATAATISAGGQLYQQQQQQQQGSNAQQPQLQPVVATLVTNLACNLRSGIGNLVYAGVAERIEDGAGAEAEAGAESDAEAEARNEHVQVLDPSTREMLSLPPPPSALPDEHGLASAESKMPSSLPAQAQALSPLDEPRQPGEELASSALEPPSVDEHQPCPAEHTERERSDTGDESLDGWVLDAYDEAEFKVENGKLVEVRVPVPSVEYEEMIEEALERRGIGCVRRPRGLPFPRRRRTFAEFGLDEAEEPLPLDRSASERKIGCESSGRDEERPEATAGKNGNGKARHPVLRWVQRRRQARQQKRERKSAAIAKQASQQQYQPQQEPQPQPQSQSTITEAGPAELDQEDEGYDASSSERTARAKPAPPPRNKKSVGAVGRPPRSRSVPVARRRGPARRAKSKIPKCSDDDEADVDAAGPAGRRRKSKSPKRPRSFKKSAKKARRKRNRNRAVRRRAVSLDDLAAAALASREDGETEEDEELEEDPFGRLKPLPSVPWPRRPRATPDAAAAAPDAAAAAPDAAAASAPPRPCPAAPIAQVIRRTCGAAAASCGGLKPHPSAPAHPVLAFAATATARVVENLLLQQQQPLPPLKLPAAPSLPPLAKLLPMAAPVPALPAASPEEAKAEAPPLHVPPPAAFHKLPPLPAAPVATGEADETGLDPRSDDDDDNGYDAAATGSSDSDVASLPPSEQESTPGTTVEEETASDVESLLEELTRTLDEALGAYPASGEAEADGDDDEATAAPSLAGTDVSSVAEEREDSQSVRRRVGMFESLGDVGVLAAKPGRPPMRGRSWTAPPAMVLPPPPALVAKDEDVGAAPSVEGGTAATPVVPTPPPPSPPPPSPLKVVFVGDKVGSIPGVADMARRLASHHRRLCRRSGDKKAAPAFEVWNGPGAGGNTVSFGHHASQSLFFVPDALHVLFWDMALDDPKTYPRGRRRRRGGSDPSDEEDDDGDHFAAEEARRRADRALERRAEEDVLAWADHLLRALEGRRRPGASGGTCAVLPVAVAPAGADMDEVRRRCDLLRGRLLRRCEERARQRHGAAPSAALTPDLIFPGEEGTVLCIGADDNAESLRAAIESIAAGRRRQRRPLPTVSPHPSDLSSISSSVRDIVQELKQVHKVVSVERIVVLLQQMTKCQDAVVAKNAVTECLESLSEEGDILYFVGSPDTAKSVPSWAAAWSNEETTDQVISAEIREDDILRQFVVLNPRWLLSAISCILRPDLRRELVETRNLMSSQLAFDSSSDVQPESSQLDTPLSTCPVITSEDVRLLWRSMAFMREASDDIASDAPSTASLPCPILFEYLEKVLEHSGVFLPLWSSPTHSPPTEQLSTLYLLPGLLTQDPPSDIWTYKAKESWSATLCHSWLFRDNVPPGTMERVTGAVLRDLLNVKTRKGTTPVRVHQVMVWRSAFMLKLGMDVVCPQTGERTESVIEMFGHLAGASASSSGPPCVASDSMGSGMKRLTVSAKGQAGDAGRKIWEGGFSTVTRSITHALKEAQEGPASIEREIVCPDCLSYQHPCEANTWKADWVQSFKQKGHVHMRCGRGHNVEIALICGTRPGSSGHLNAMETKPLQPPVTPVSSLLEGVVVVGLWDGRSRQIRNVGSGFVADKEKGLIVTASHILFDMQSTERFGQEFFGLKDAKVVIGVIPRPGNSSSRAKDTTAVFRYFAEIITHDVRNVDACILRITTKFEEDVGGEGEGCGDQPEIPLKNNIRAMKAERLHQLKLTKKFELDEDVRILGYNQGGEGRLKPGTHVNRSADFARGYVVRNFRIPANERVDTGLSKGFHPLEETVVMCPTISGHSGGPCVNQEGVVIGILSRADPADRQRCYLVPASELKKLLKKAKAKCTMSPLDLYYRT